MERRTCVLLLAMLLPWLGSCTIVLDEELMALPKEELAAHISRLLSRPGAAVTVDDLPQARPPVHWFCDYSCSKNINIGSSQGVFTLDMTYKPLQGVDSYMMTWLLDNLHRPTVMAADNKTYPMYLVFHGIDHLHHEVTPDSVGLGTTITWNEIPLTGCYYDSTSATEPWKCPRGRAGFTKSDPKQKWANMFHTKVEMTVTRYDRNGIEFVRKEHNALFGGDGSRIVATTRHTWADSSEGLQLRTQQWLGLMAPHSTTAFDTSIMAPVVNMVIKDKYIDGAKNVPKGNITAIGYMAALHYLQEYGSLKSWLPQAYRANNAIKR